jgi:hypothetical protein
MRHFKEDEKMKNEDFPMIGLHSQRNEDCSGLYDHFLKESKKENEIKNNNK